MGHFLFSAIIVKMTEIFKWHSSFPGVSLQDFDATADWLVVVFDEHVCRKDWRK